MRHAVGLALLLASLSACVASGGPDHPDVPHSTLTIRTDVGPVVLDVEVAKTDEERARGLMGRERLPADQGMVFLYRQPVTNRFWMKDTLIPLSIAFWNEAGRIVAILDMPPCEQEPCPTYGPDDPYVGAVEANRGFFAENGAQAGDRVELQEAAYE